MAIITFSREIGSYGTEIAEKTAKVIKYKCLDKNYIKKSFVKYDFSEKNIKKISEENLSLFDFLFTNKDKYYHFMKMTVCEFAQDNNCIILGMGSEIFFKDIPGVFHVRVFAPFEKRLERIKKIYSCNDNKAKSILKESDHSRASLYKFFFNLSWEDSHLYDLIINSDKLSIDNIILLLKNSIEEIEKTTDKNETSKSVKNLLLSEKITTKILYKENIPIQNLEVKVDNKTIILSGIVDHSDYKINCENIAQEIDKVKDVKNNIILSKSRGIL